MKLGVTKLSSSVRLALSLGAVIAVGTSGTVFAQDTGSQDTSKPSQEKAQTLQTVVVTGSHIRRVDLETSNPVVTIDAAQIKATGKLTLGDIVQQLPAVTGGNINPQVNNSGGTGGSSIGLRGLGAQRTLILIDGKRIINSDPNSIPADMIERIEVLTDGASSVYGSDAIGGVVNFILKKDYQGAQFSATYGESDHNDGATTGYRFTFGQTSDKGSIMGGVDYNKTEAVLAKNRDFSKNAVSIYGSSQTPIYSYVGGSSFPAYGRVQLPTQYRGTGPGQYNCKNVALNPGASGQNIATDYHCFTNADKYNYAAVNLIQTPQERTSLWLKGTYNLGDHVQAYMDAYHNKTSSGFQLAPALLGSLYGAVISKDAYYNPFGREYSAAGLDYRARLVSAGSRAANYGTTTDQIHTGFKGDFNLLNHDWNWDVGMSYGHFSQQTITRGLPNQDKINKDLGPSRLDAASGKVVCNSGAAGCMPFNPFNLFDPNSVAALQAAAVPAISNQFNIERVYSADVNGGVFDLPAGTVQLAAGASYRKEYTRAEIDPLLLIDPSTGNCTLGSQCSSPLRGGYNVKEAYAEVFVPILTDMPFAQSLNVTIGDRYSKYSTFGSTNNKKFAVEYRPITDLLLRGTVSEVFRAPTIGNVFGAPISDAPKLSSDPCDHITTANPACVGVPTDGSFVNQDAALGQQIKGISSGSKYAGFPLGPEKGKSFDLGLVYSPSYVPGLSLSVDAWHLYLKDTISSIGAQTVLDLCYAGLNQYCPLVSRFPTGSANPGQIAQIIEPTGNLGRTDVAGVDFSARYKLPEFSFGKFVVGLDGTYMSRYDQQTAPGTSANTVFHDAGHFMPFGSSQASTCPSGGGVCLFPRWRGNGFVNWDLGDWSASWRMRYIGAFRNGSKSPSQDTNPVQNLPGVVFKYGATIYNDVSIGYNIEQFNTRLDFGVNNLFDKQPPFLYANNTLNANTDPSDFDLQGRYFWGRVTVSF
ncbi:MULTISPECIES: TonB-dependent receptor plug domain-containing protein [Rhodanobacter]|uniref:TonB-dependent receptor plug domain-containing protein n=1 Tax=Rhodanobacter TaxID=75309 RepID=UPI0003F84387|nr:MULTISPECIES: TonB-dependent receptor [Rhodanobacter]TAN17932.1 MAG: TonB-dependent receptor [Rhodanobacter sp.]UJJ55573.1 TonB-dependent receptor [Rhodanobacter thiooxydans]